MVDVDELTHWSIDIYDNAMLVIALKNMREFALEPEDKKKWGDLHERIGMNSKKYLWDEKRNKFVPHIYVSDSPFPEDFEENAIHYHGGTAVAIEAGILNRQEIAAVLDHMVENVKLSGAPSIGLTLYPPYPSEVLGKNVSPPYEYQNGGDWTWFGGRMIQQLIANDFVEEAYDLVQPMIERVLKNEGFYEWYKIDGTPAGSGDFKGSAGVLAKSSMMFKEWVKITSSYDE
ncbi:amylo-alpha-1,6-glucosidase [Arenibacter palladensis]|uniref:amylo-alpha-1,6-glucosidase n=1 Tax=Arenibacter palladensis TaxID=237373 RepID=UPI0026E2E83C|nr:amylo-alpha-1,6-glucosidase [Arenibacter palladensis]MDO6605307.1 amylo-alpha-1,6-glucosidase [Arenibacter palladensis]